MHRRTIVLLLSVLALLVGNTQVVSASHTKTCDGFDFRFAGDEMGDSVRYGARADFPGTNPDYLQLCTGTSAAFSSTWVALQGLGPYDIFQVGLDRCRAGACNYAADGKIHKFWAWGRNYATGSEGCGTTTPVQPALQDLGVWNGAPTNFKVRKVVSSGVATFRAYINDVQVAQIMGSSLCWAGAHSIPGFYAEIGDPSSATGGSATNKYRITEAERQDTVAGPWVNTFFHDPCFANSSRHRCDVIQTITLDWWAVQP